MKEKVVSRELHGKISDERKIAEVLAFLPLRVESMLNNYRVSLTGKRRRVLRKKYKYNPEWEN